VQLTYRLYTALQSTSTIAAKPGFNGFTVKERKADETPLPDKIVDGRHYRGFTVWQVLLTPLQPGDYAIDPLSIDNTISYTTIDGKTAHYSGPVTSNKAMIHVIPLPAAGQPQAFAGLVGQWAIKSRLSSPQLDAGDYDTVLVEITGAGSFDNITTPAITWPAGFRHFDAMERWNINDSTVPESGTKRIAIPFTANTPGQYHLPAMQLAWFDPVTKTYPVMQTDSLALRVVGTAASAPAKARVRIWKITNVRSSGATALAPAPEPPPITAGDPREPARRALSLPAARSAPHRRAGPRAR